MADLVSYDQLRTMLEAEITEEGSKIFITCYY